MIQAEGTSADFLERTLLICEAKLYIRNNHRPLNSLKFICLLLQDFGGDSIVKSYTCMSNKLIL